MTERPALTVRMAAERLGLRGHAVLALIRSGALVASDVSLHPGGRPRWRITEEAIEDFLSARMHRVAVPRRRRRKPQNVKAYF